MNNQDRWQLFIKELKVYIEEHHHLPDKHKVESRGLLNKVKYARKKMKEGTLTEDKAKALEEILNMRDFSEHTGGRRKKSDNTENK